MRYYNLVFNTDWIANVLVRPLKHNT
jgi:hypothetical protein